MGQLVGFQVLSGNPSQGLLLKQSGLGVDCKEAKNKPTSVQSTEVARHFSILPAIGRVQV